MSEATLFEAAGGSDAMLRLARAWHRRCLADEILQHPFSHPGQHPDHLTRLAAYWGEALGGPPRYSDGMADQSHVVRLHAGNGEHDEMNRRAVALFALAVSDAGIPDDDGLHDRLVAYFAWSTAQLAAHPDGADDVGDGLAVPHWSWSGLSG